MWCTYRVLLLGRTCMYNYFLKIWQIHGTILLYFFTWQHFLFPQEEASSASVCNFVTGWQWRPRHTATGQVRAVKSPFTCSCFIMIRCIFFFFCSSRCGSKKASEEWCRSCHIWAVFFKALKPHGDCSTKQCLNIQEKKKFYFTCERLNVLDVRAL